MTTLTAYYSLDMSSSFIWFGTPTLATYNEIDITSGSYLQKYYGSFNYNIYGLSGGTVSSTKFYYYNTLYYEVSGGTFSAVTVNNYLNSYDQNGLLNYVLSGTDIISGSWQDDVLKSFAGNDTIIGGGGNDIIDGGTGIDRAVFYGSYSSASIVKNSNGSVTIATNLDGTDTLYNVEYAQFSDRTVSLVNSAPTFTSGTAAITPENVATTKAVYTAIASDPDVGTVLTYSISGGIDANLFNINASTGAVTFKTSPNFEAPADSGGDNIYNITIQVSDGSLTASQSVSITVTDVPENITPTVSSLSRSPIAKPVITGTALHDTTVRIYDSATLIGTTTTNKQGVWSFTPASDLTTGSHSITATAVDASGNVSSASTAQTLTIALPALTVSGPSNNNAVVATSSAEVIYGGTGNKAIYGGGGDDVIYANAGSNTTIVLGAGNGCAYGSTGRDYLYGGAGDQVLDGGTGAVDVLIAGSSGTQRLYGGGGGYDYLFGGAGTNLLYGNATATTDVEVMNGGSGTTTMTGGMGTNYFYAGTGATTMYGGSGVNIYVTASTSQSSTIVGGSGANYLYAGSHGDVATGGSNVDVFVGGSGNDTLEGGGGVDYAFGGAGSDTFILDLLKDNYFVVADFNTGGTQDVVRFLNTPLTSYADVVAHEAYYAGINTTIITPDSNTGAAIWLVGIQPNQLSASNFTFV